MEREHDWRERKNRFIQRQFSCSEHDAMLGGGGGGGEGELQDGNCSELLEGVCGPKPLASAKMVVDVRFEGL